MQGARTRSGDLGAQASLLRQLRTADGVLGHGIFTDRWWEDVVDPELARGAASSGRDAAALKRWGWLITAIDDTDPQRAVREARLQIAFYLTVRTYDSLVELHGWHDQVAAIRAAFRSGHPDTISEHVTDEMLWAIAICGDTAQAREMLDKIYPWLDERLAGRTWAAGEAFTLADCAAAPSLFYADWVHRIPETMPALRAYRARLNARPSMALCIEEARPYRAYFPLGAPDRD